MIEAIKILQLYPEDLNVYGDNGNLLTLVKRLEWRGHKTEVIKYNLGDILPEKVDIILAGGGQDSSQAKIQDDFIKIAPTLKKFVEANVPTLLICGSYQMFGKYFQTTAGEKILGANILDLHTTAGKKRLIGNLVVSSPVFGEIVGYENHSGQTYLGKNLQPLGKVLKGAGNNGKDNFEGVFYKNLIGTYCHGPVLAKNPNLADFIIEKALDNVTGRSDNLPPLDDATENEAHRQSANRPR